MLELNRTIDHTLLKPEATKTQITELCLEAKKFHFASVCVNTYNVPLAASLLKNTSVAVCTVIGFPLGASLTDIKKMEASLAIKNGATEIDMVINVGAIKSQDWNMVAEDISEVKKVCGDYILKVILETCLLTDEEIARAAQCAEKAGADFIKTSTGFSTGGATLKAIEIMKNAVSEKVKLKASGGIRDLKTANEYLNLGVHRLGTSAGVALMENKISDNAY